MKVETKVEASEYGLLGSGRERRGTLLRVTWSETVVGFADLHTWPELGHPSVDEVLRTQRGIFWDLALQASRRDGEARARGELLTSAASGAAGAARGVRQHRLWMSTWDLSVGRILQARREGFAAVKLKIDATDLPGEARRLSALAGWWGDSLRLRLDLNSRAQADSLARFLAALPIRLRELIDYIEDPFAFDARSWADFAKREAVLLAWDQPGGAGAGAGLSAGAGAEGEAGAAAAEAEAAAMGCVRIWKPLWELEPTAKWSRLVVTSSLGHPVGSLYAAAEAARVVPDEIHGCASHLVYQPTPGFEVNMRGDRLNFVGDGAGVGFGSSLARLKWRDVALV